MLREFARGCGLALLALLAHPLLAMESADVVGEAYDLQRGQLLYREHHFCDSAARRCRVEYQDSDGRTIARKIIDYSRSELAPALQFTDVRFAEEFTLDFSASEGLVVDAGFDNFIRSRWADLSNGLAVDFQFRVVNAGRPLDMNVRSPLNGECALDKLCFEARLDAWYLRVFTRPIQLTYDRNSQRLERYRGISNIRAGDGGRQNVEILYSYQNSNDE